MVAHFPRIDTRAHEIEDRGEKLSNDLKMCRFIIGPSPKFSNIRSIWFIAKESRTMDTLLTRLQLEGDSRNRTEREESASVDRALNAAAANSTNRYIKDKGGNKSSGKSDKSKVVCYICSKIGHFKHNCLNTKEKGSNGNENNGEMHRRRHFRQPKLLRSQIAATFGLVIRMQRSIWFSVENGALIFRRTERDVVRSWQTLEYWMSKEQAQLKLMLWRKEKWLKRRIEDVRRVPEVRYIYFRLCSNFKGS